MRVIFVGALFFFLIRIISLGILPIFNDEGIYFTWGGRLVEDLGNPHIFISQDGKQVGTPLIYGLSSYLPFDPLINGRIINVFFSLVTYFSVSFIALRYSKKNIIPLVLLLIFNPYSLLYDRMAIPEAIVTAFFTLALLFVYRLSGKFQLRDSIAIGIIVALGWYIKSTILLFFIPLVLYYIYSFFIHKTLKLRIILSLTITLLTFYAVILPHIAHPLYKKFTHIEYDRILTLNQIFRLPLPIWTNNIIQAVILLLSYATPLVVLSYVMVILSFRGNKKIIFPLLWSVIPYLFTIFFLKNIDARYLAITFPLLLMVVSYSLDFSTIKGKILGYLTLFSVVFMGLLMAFFPLDYYQILRKFVPENRLDLGQYVTGWPSGYGVKGASDWLSQKSKEKPMFVFIRDDAGNPEDGMVLYLRKNEKIIVLPVGLMPELYINRDRLVLPDPNFYFVSRGTQMAGIEERVKEVARFQKPLDKEYVGVYEIIR